MPAASTTKNESALITHAIVKVDGTLVPTKVMDRMIEISVESSMYLPDMVILVFHDNELELIDGNTFPLGAKIEVEASDVIDPRQTDPIFKGEIVALEPDFLNGTMATMTIRGYTKGHRMHRESKSQVWKDVKDSDIATQIASNNGLSTKIDATNEVFQHIFQHAITDMAFLRQRAERIGYEVYIQDETLHFHKPDPTGSPVKLEWGNELLTFRPQLSISDQVNEVTVRGWDPKKKEAIVGQASSSPTAPEIGMGNWGGQAAQTALSAAKKLEVRYPVQSQSDADAVALGILNEINGSFIEAEGEAMGQPTLRAGMLVDLVKLGTKFSGKYKLTSVRHVYSVSDHYKTFITVEGHRPRTFSYLLRAQTEVTPWAGVVPAIVTNVDISSDSKNSSMDYAMVKVKYPWLDDSQESFWARLTGPGFGKQRGVYFMPEVNDEVLVAFEHGDFNRPYILGGLYGGKDDPISPISQIFADGQVKTRVIKTRTGHTIRFVDLQGGEEFIEIVDAKQNTRILMDTQNKKIEMTSKGDIQIEAEGNMTLKAKGAIDVQATRGLTAKGQTVDVSAQSNGSFKASAKLDLQGATLSAQGSGIAEVKAGGALNLTGSLVKIN